VKHAQPSQRLQQCLPLARSPLVPLAVLLLGAAQAGCLGSSQPVVLHMLRPVSPTAAAPAPAPALEVMPVRVPELLQRPQMVFVQGPDRLALSDVHQWGGPLDKELQRVLVQDLAALLGDGVVPYPEGPQVGAALRLEVSVQRFEGQPGGALVLEATWAVLRGDGPAAARKRTRVEEQAQGADADGLAAAHSRAVAALAGEIAAAVRGVK
jgi:uncharacterized lipoprotein YmbA